MQLFVTRQIVAASQKIIRICTTGHTGFVRSRLTRVLDSLEDVVWIGASRASGVDLTYKRPAHGISPTFRDDIIGMKAMADLAEDQVLAWKDIAS